MKCNKTEMLISNQMPSQQKKNLLFILHILSNLFNSILINEKYEETSVTKTISQLK